ncbi:MAG: potassium channel protein [Caldilineaceae bacterium]|nr:potassium channel protein [Caldilineaceae bacterium]MBP8107141.1 potassium channel protein [Caldilineaceae bacterium]MBP8121485.1 potassium channel protein [Caldilineaceae bacterium]MBP9074083.1 potassium channel protein [Caldilineaceae bacterium]
MNNELSLSRRLLVVIGLFAGLMMVGTVSYILIEGWSWQDSLFMTVITLSTVGFGEVRPLSNGGEIFTIGLIVMGVGGAAYTFSTVADYIVAGELRGILRRQRMQKKINQLTDHFIVCGYGRVGKRVALDLKDNGADVVLVESDPESAVSMEKNNFLFVMGDASDDVVLRQAGIERAKGFCSCLPSDADNVFAVLTARTLNRGLTIIARADKVHSERKLLVAGANHVISPHAIGGHRMASQLLHPNVMEFLDVVMRQGNLELWIEEVVVHHGSDLEDHTLADGRIRTRTGANVLAVRRPDGTTFTDPGGSFTLQYEDCLIALGTPEQLMSLADLANDSRDRLRDRVNNWQQRRK